MNQRTVVVVGAGASKEVNLPTGYELKQIISNLLDFRFDLRDQKSGDPLILGALERIVQKPEGKEGDINPYLSAASHIRDSLSLAISIDNFIDSQRGNEKIALCGKLAICRAILEAEKRSLIFFASSKMYDRYDFLRLDGTWYLPFFQLLTENCEITDLQDRFSSVSLIIFNYDRCIEHFLFNAVRDYYQLPDKEAATVVQAIHIYHPYGSVGQLSWQNAQRGIEFGATPQAEHLLAASERIRTFTEGTDPEGSEIHAIRQHMRSASRVLFIGFAFHRLNMQLISPNGSDRGVGAPQCFATTLGISNSDELVIRNQIDSLFQHPVDTKMVNAKCADFFSEFWMSLAF